MSRDYKGRRGSAIGGLSGGAGLLLGLAIGLGVAAALYIYDRRPGAQAPTTPQASARADRTGLFNCPHTGVALAALEKLVRRGDIRRSDRVVVISTAHGLKFVDFKLRYHEMRLEGIAPNWANPAIELPAEYGPVRDRMLREIDARFGA